MYLIDSEIEKRLGDLKIETARADHPFKAATQVQPCSIDLRIDNLVWRAGRHRTIDMRSALIDKLRPRRGWLTRKIREGDVIAIKPRELVFARIYERFTMPSDLAGKIEGRSSFARLGLSVHCTSDFINPGWRGNMPLQLYNAGPHTIRIPPYMPVCQLHLIRLAAAPRRPYGHEELDSKYQNDDGGPSYWWRDKRIKELHDRLKERSLPLSLEQTIADLTRGREVEIIERFQRYLDGVRAEDAHDEHEVIDRFAKREWRRWRFNQLVKWALGLGAAKFAWSVVSLIVDGKFYFSDWETWKHVVPTLALGLPWLWMAFLRAQTGYLLPENVERARAEQAHREEAQLEEAREAAARLSAQSAESSPPEPPQAQ